jgi:CheY-like chemotaxis protein
LAGSTVLVVEDDHQVTSLLDHQLQRLGFHTVIAGSVEHGFRLAQALPLVATFVDVGLPDGDGWTLCERFRADPLLRGVPITIISGLADPEIALRAAVDGYGFMPKGDAAAPCAGA